MTTPAVPPRDPPERAGQRAPTTVVLVDDSPVQRRFLRAVLEGGPDFVVVGEARTGREAVALVERLRPTVVLMDLDLPVMNGMEAIESIMAGRPTPIMVYSAFVADGAGSNAVAALAAGAVDVMAKPRPGESAALDRHAEALLGRLRLASRASVITHPRARLRAPSPGRPLLPAAGRDPLVVGRTCPHTASSGPVRLIAVGASTGGPAALAELLRALPADLAAAVLVVQHMADGFVEGLAQWLDGCSSLPVAVAVDGARLRAGTVTLAPGNRNLLVHEQLRVSCAVPPATQFHVPGIDATFASVAHAVGPQAVGVLLTGMGRDGAVGLAEIHDRGGLTIGQDEASCAVYGMPQAAREIGALDHQLALADIAPMVVRLAGPHHREPEPVQ